MKKQILAVDDDVVILKLLTHILQKKYDIVVQSSGIDAFAWLEEGKFPDVIISDLQMPYFHGQSFVRNLKISGFYRNTPILVLSGVPDIEEQVSKMPIPIEAWIRKPFNPPGLLQKLEELILNYPVYASNG